MEWQRFIAANQTHLDGRLDGSLEPNFVSLLFRSIELVVGLECHIGEEWGLGSAEVLYKRDRKERESGHDSGWRVTISTCKS